CSTAVTRGTTHKHVHQSVPTRRSSDLFAEGETVDVTGTTKGHGYQGNIHKDNQSRGPMAHGSRYHRRPGSLGAIINRVFKGMKLDRKSTRLNSSHVSISYAVFCLTTKI